MQIYFYTFCEQTHVHPYPAKSIIAFNEDDIWISSGSQIAHWNGNFQDTTICNALVSINSIWGSSSEDMYFVGNNGSIVHYDGSNFEKMESGTETDINFITGTPDGNYVFASGRYNGTIMMCYSKAEDKWNTLYYETDNNGYNGEYGYCYAIGVTNKYALFSASYGILKYYFKEKKRVFVTNNELGFDCHTENIFVIDNNDMLYTGVYRYTYFNGKTYYYNRELRDLIPHSVNYNSDYNGNIFSMVGAIDYYSYSIIIRGKRN